MAIAILIVSRRVMLRRLARQRVGVVSLVVGSVRSVPVMSVLESAVVMRFLMEMRGMEMRGMEMRGMEMLIALMMRYGNLLWRGGRVVV